MTMNVHLLLHLSDTVKRLGPLWGHSCFPFESLNGYLLTLFHGTTHVDKQVKYEILHRIKVIFSLLLQYCNICTHICV